MKLTDRPGRYCAIFIFSPLLFISAILVYDCEKYVSYILLSLSTSLFIYELFWINFKKDETIYI